ncbi:aldo/keto reductase [Actinotignum sp. GS-2025f]|uniref:aldo/keto reductase n=1 Tax=unclassified Actinotignum TaxID=2632702 RepID=UPI002A83D0B1|nr:aldo/keto reductase [Actinotignum sp. SLA_B059]MDY5127486.1 aldo/keto reductase [Actinotignum sp. SLA_B059]
MTTCDIPTVPLADGGQIPLVGIGSLLAKGNELATTLGQIIADGYRLVDTAQQYANETAVGEAVKRSGVPRAQVFITSKVAGGEQGKRYTRRSIEDSLRRLDTDYLDALLIHWPNPSRGLYVETWEEMLTAQSEGLVRHVGVSNFLPEHLTHLHEASGVWPVLNQIQLSVALPRTNLRAFHERHGIVTQAWRPLGGPEKLLDQIVVARLAAKHGVSAGQIVLRWCVQQGIVVIPSSSQRERWRANADLFSFTLDESDMRDLAALDTGDLHVWDARTHEEW